jgi:hypothetical protein
LALEVLVMTPLERIFELEVEFHRRLRTEARGSGDARGAHTSYAIQAGYEQLIKEIGDVTASEIETLKERFNLAGDARDVLAASDSVKALLGIQN